MEMAVGILADCSFTEIESVNEVAEFNDNSDMDMEKKHKQHAK